MIRGTRTETCVTRTKRPESDDEEEWSKEAAGVTHSKLTCVSVFADVRCRECLSASTESDYCIVRVPVPVPVPVPVLVLVLWRSCTCVSTEFACSCAYSVLRTRATIRTAHCQFFRKASDPPRGSTYRVQPRYEPHTSTQPADFFQILSVDTLSFHLFDGDSV